MLIGLANNDDLLPLLIVDGDKQNIWFDKL